MNIRIINPRRKTSIHEVDYHHNGRYYLLCGRSVGIHDCEEVRDTMDCKVCQSAVRE